MGGLDVNARARAYLGMIPLLAGFIVVLVGAGRAGPRSSTPPTAVCSDTLRPTTFPFGPCPSEAENWNVGDGPVPLDTGVVHAKGLVDVRGVGDAGMAMTYEQPPPLTHRFPDGERASFGRWLDALDTTGTSYRADLAFINWESVVGPRCAEFQGEPGPTSYAFVSRPGNVVEAHERGFNLIGLANNHSQDCVQAPGGRSGTQMSAAQMDSLGRAISANWLWHGVGTADTARVRTIMIDGRTVRVAFASLYMAQKQCAYAVCGAARDRVLTSLSEADADLRILSLHSWNDETQRQLVETGETFLRNYDGDIVFGHGPHVWRDVRIVESEDGDPGVLFESLGNFLHPSLAGQPRNLIGRVLLDAETLQVRQVQALSLSTDGLEGWFDGAPSPTEVPANRSWRLIQDSTWQSGVTPDVRGAYFTVEPGR